MGAALGRRDGVAIGMAEPFLLVLGPATAHSTLPPSFRKIDLPRNGRGVGSARPSRLAERVTEPAREVQPGLGRNSFRPGAADPQLQRISMPRNR